jgi:hypothetical protein
MRRGTMSTIKAIVRGGRLEVDVPAEWVEGTEVEIHPVGRESRAEDGALPPEEIARILAAMDRMIPFELTPEEEAEIEAQRQKQKEWEKAHFAEHAEKLRKMWE